MKRVSELLAIPAIACFIVLMLWGEQVKEFSIFLFFAMVAVLGVGFVSGQIQSSRDRDKAIANNAVAKFKKERGITD